MAGRLILTNTAAAPVRARYDAANYADLTVSSAGDLTIAPTGGDTTVTGKLLVTGDLGLGTTDVEAVGTGYRSLQLGTRAHVLYSTAAGALHISQNAYWDGGWKYRTTDAASQVKCHNGYVEVLVSPSGSIDTALSWTTALTVANSGATTLSSSLTAASLALTAASVSTTATAGTRTLPSNPANFLALSINGSTVKIPYYAS